MSAYAKKKLCTKEYFSHMKLLSFYMILLIIVFFNSFKSFYQKQACMVLNTGHQPDYHVVKIIRYVKRGKFPVYLPLQNATRNNSTPAKDYYCISFALRTWDI